VGPASIKSEKFEGEIMKPLRFRRLLQARTENDVAIQMRRLVQLCESKLEEKKTLDINVLGESILNWSDPVKGESTRTHWAYQYYNAPGDAPEFSQQDDTIMKETQP
jgi:CRISPR type I-E-associated protein CasB/Cse2